MLFLNVEIMKKQAKFWEKLDNKKVQCNLCAHHCKINEDKVGICSVRKNENYTLYTTIYGACSSIAVDPIEKKPLYHFHPGTNAFSIGTVGCNFKCLHCQNYTIATADETFGYNRDLTAEDTVDLAKQNNCSGIAYTYNEPTIWHEFTFDSAKLAKKAGLYTCYVTNGYITEEPLKELSNVLDAMNIDVKAFTDSFYKKVCKASLKPVLKTCELAKELGIHIELTYLVIPGYNDSLEEVRDFCNWVLVNLDKKTPVHFSRFHPYYKMKDVPMTPLKTLNGIYDIARKSGLSYVYLGNVAHGDYENTFCPNCGNLCIERQGYSVDLVGIKDNKCLKCGKKIDIVI